MSCVSKEMSKADKSFCCKQRKRKGKENVLFPFYTILVSFNNVNPYDVLYFDQIQITEIGKDSYHYASMMSNTAVHWYPGGHSNVKGVSGSSKNSRN